MNHKKIEYTEKELESEYWKTLPNYESLYEVSNLGRIRTKENKITYTKKHGERHWKQRILKYKCKNDLTGYRVDLWKDGKPKTCLVARLVASAFIKDEFNNKKLTINHINGNRLDNRIENLEWCTLAENIRKGFEAGLYQQKKVKIINKNTNEVNVYRSLSLGSKAMNYNNGYLSNKIKKNLFENKNYKWELV